VLWVVRLHLWMMDHPFKERMRIHQRWNIGKRSDIEFTPFGVNSLKFPCLPHLRKYLLPLILCRAQAWWRANLKSISSSQNRDILSQPLISWMNRFKIFILARVLGISTMVLVRPLSPLHRLDPWISLFMILLWGKSIRPVIRHTLPYWGQNL
jgi:hypothetical protein